MTKEELLNGESENIEFKVQRTEDSSKYMKTVVAFANGKGGTLIFGIDDKTHEVTGIDKESIFREMDAITEAISDSCEPAIIPDIYLQTIDEKSVIVVEIAPEPAAAVLSEIQRDNKWSLCQNWRYYPSCRQRHVHRNVLRGCWQIL